MFEDFSAKQINMSGEGKVNSALALSIISLIMIIFSFIWIVLHILRNSKLAEHERYPKILKHDIFAGQ